MLYEMLLGSTCDKGLTMEAYLEMMEQRGAPLPNKLKMFHQHLLSSMLQFNHGRRYGCDQILKEMNLNNSHLEKQNSLVHLRNTTNAGEVRHKTAMFHSLIVPSQQQQKIVMMVGRASMERGLRSEQKPRDQNENMQV